MTNWQTRVRTLRLSLADTIVGQPMLLDRLVIGVWRGRCFTTAF